MQVEPMVARVAAPRLRHLDGTTASDSNTALAACYRMVMKGEG